MRFLARAFPAALLFAVATLFLGASAPPARAQVTCPTALPPATNFTSSNTTQGQFKTNLTNLVSYLTCLIGTDGTVATAKSSLGLATVATSGNYGDLSNTPTALPPNGAAGGDLAGTYPNPTLAAVGSATTCTNATVTTDAKGRVTSCSSGTAVTGTLVAGTANAMSPLASSSGVNAVAHGLGKKPDLMRCYMENLTAEGGYNVGDRIEMPQGTGGSNGVLVAAESDATNTTIMIESGTISIPREDTGGIFTITKSNWKAVCTPYKIN